MQMSKRDFLALGAAAGASFTLPAWAETKPLIASISMFVPAAPGGGWDSTARAIERAAKAAGLVGNMQFENVGGAGGMVAPQQTIPYGAVPTGSLTPTYGAVAPASRATRDGRARPA